MLCLTRQQVVRASSRQTHGKVTQLSNPPRVLSALATLLVRSHKVTAVVAKNPLIGETVQLVTCKQDHEFIAIPNPRSTKLAPTTQSRQLDAMAYTAAEGPKILKPSGTTRISNPLAYALASWYVILILTPLFSNIVIGRHRRFKTTQGPLYPSQTNT
jgi:hypothetical protein